MIREYQHYFNEYSPTTNLVTLRVSVDMTKVIAVEEVTVTIMPHESKWESKPATRIVLPDTSYVLVEPYDEVYKDWLKANKGW